MDIPFPGFNFKYLNTLIANFTCDFLGACINWLRKGRKHWYKTRTFGTKIGTAGFWEEEAVLNCGHGSCPLDTSRVQYPREIISLVFFITCPIPIIPIAIVLDMMKNELCKITVAHQEKGNVMEMKGKAVKQVIYKDRFDDWIDGVELFKKSQCAKNMIIELGSFEIAAKSQFKGLRNLDQSWKITCFGKKCIRPVDTTRMQVKTRLVSIDTTRVRCKVKTLKGRKHWYKTRIFGTKVGTAGFWEEEAVLNCGHGSCPLDTSRVQYPREILSLVFFITCPIPIIPIAIVLDMMKNELCKSRVRDFVGSRHRGGHPIGLFSRRSSKGRFDRGKRIMHKDVTSDVCPYFRRGLGKDMADIETLRDRPKKPGQNNGICSVPLAHFRLILCGTGKSTINKSKFVSGPET
ncbi:hypothetical protein LXL04_025228 [Taraxacum kok-saghyz]